MLWHSGEFPSEPGTHKFLSSSSSFLLHCCQYALPPQVVSFNKTRASYKQSGVRKILGLLLAWSLAAWTTSSQQSGFADETKPEIDSSSRRFGSAALSSLPGLGSTPKQPEITISVEPLDAREVGCLAACRWHPAIGLKQRAQTIQRLFCQDSLENQQASRAIARFLHFQAAFQEDIGAASAMRTYYSQIGVLEQQKWMVAAGESVERQQQKQQSLMDQGFAAGIDLSWLQRKNLDLQDNWLQTDSQLRQLQKLLTSLTGLDFSTSSWICEPLVIQANTLNCELLVAQALRQRCDLLAWQELSCRTDEASAPMIATLISPLSGSFGLPMPTASLLGRLFCQGLDPCVLVSSLRQELTVIAQTQQAFIEQSVREKCEQLQLAYQRHEVELQRIDNWLARLAQLERLESLGQTRPDQRLNAESGLLEARATEVTRRLEAKLAEVALAEAVGGLAASCCQGKAWLPNGF